jgi:hypothetical protein
MTVTNVVLLAVIGVLVARLLRLRRALRSARAELDRSHDAAKRLYDLGVGLRREELREIALRPTPEIPNTDQPVS